MSRTPCGVYALRYSTATGEHTVHTRHLVLTAPAHAVGAILANSPSLELARAGPLLESVEYPCLAAVSVVPSCAVFLCCAHCALSLFLLSLTVLSLSRGLTALSLFLLCALTLTMLSLFRALTVLSLSLCSQSHYALTDLSVLVSLLPPPVMSLCCCLSQRCLFPQAV